MADLVSALSLVLGALLCGLFTILFVHYSSFWLVFPKAGARLPKGTYGWPVIGETLALTRDPINFTSSHQKRYGSIFKSYVNMRKTILGTTPEFAKFVVLNTALFPVQYAASVLFSPDALLMTNPGPRHVALKRIFVKLSLPPSLAAMIRPLESIILQNLALWEEKGTIVASEMTDKLVLETGAFISCGVTNIRSTAEGREAIQNLITIFTSFFAFPINLPGTARNKGLKAMDALTAYLLSELQQRKSQDDSESTSMLRLMIEAGREDSKYVNDDTSVNQMIGAWFGSYKTVAMTLVWSLKYLVDYPEIFRRVQAEQQEILEGKDLTAAGPRLTFNDTKKMVYTAKFFQEVQRTVSITNNLPRRAAQDVVYNGFLIPKGWAVLSMINSLHFGESNYEDPTTFNPDRFDTPPKAYTYLPFGNGPHRCPGEEVARTTALIFIHHITTTYTYESIGPDRGVKFIGLKTVAGGYPIKIRPSK